MSVMLRLAVVAFLLSSPAFAEEPNKTEGRFQLFESHFIVDKLYTTMKIDSQTGETWVLKRINDEREGWLPLNHYNWSETEKNVDTQVPEEAPAAKKNGKKP